MKKRFVSVILIFVLAFAGFSANANVLNEKNDSGSVVNKIVNELAGFSRIDRKNLLTIVYPMFSADAGIDTLTQIIREHEEGTDGMMSEYIDKTLKYLTKDKLIMGLNSFKIIPENLRDKYLKDFMERKELALSEVNMENTDFFTHILYQKYPSLRSVFEEDGITNGTVANMLSSICAINDGNPLFFADSNSMFLPYRISSSLSDKWNEICLIYGLDADAYSRIEELTEHFNKDYSLKERQKIASLFSELGVCYIQKGNTPSFKNVSVGNNAIATFPKIYAYLNSGKILFRTENIKKDVSVATFTDIEGWYRDCITELAYMGVVDGRGRGMFCPLDFVTREEFVKMVCAAVNLAIVDDDVPFTDVDENAWYAAYIKTAYKNGIIKGTSANTFGVGTNITRQDAAVICSNILKDTNIQEVASPVFDDADMIAFYAVDSVDKLSRIGIINGDGTGKFNPRSNITRAESAKIINELIYTIAGIK